MNNEDATTLLMCSAGTRHFGINIEHVLRISEFDGPQCVVGEVQHPGLGDSIPHPYVDLRNRNSTDFGGRARRPFLVILKSGLLPWGLVVDDAWGSMCCQPGCFTIDKNLPEVPMGGRLCIRKISANDFTGSSEFYLVMPELSGVQ